MILHEHTHTHLGPGTIGLQYVVLISDGPSLYLPGQGLQLHTRPRKSSCQTVFIKRETDTQPHTGLAQQNKFHSWFRDLKKTNWEWPMNGISKQIINFQICLGKFEKKYHMNPDSVPASVYHSYLVKCTSFSVPLIPGKDGHGYYTPGWWSVLGMTSPTFPPGQWPCWWHWSGLTTPPQRYCSLGCPPTGGRRWGWLCPWAMEISLGTCHNLTISWGVLISSRTFNTSLIKLEQSILRWLSTVIFKSSMALKSSVKAAFSSFATDLVTLTMGAAGKNFSRNSRHSWQPPSLSLFMQLKKQLQLTSSVVKFLSNCWRIVLVWHTGSGFVINSLHSDVIGQCLPSGMEKNK